MKQFILLTFLLLLFKESNSQNFTDTIITKKADTIVCNITLINHINIFFTFKKSKKAAYIAKSKVSQYVLNSTGTDIVDVSIKPDTLEVVESFYKKGAKDALKYYSSDAGTGILFLSVASPIVGLIPAAVSSSNPPQEKNLGYPNAELMKDSDYHRGYTDKAWQLKKHCIWTNWGVGLAVNVAAVGILLMTHSISLK